MKRHIVFSLVFVLLCQSRAFAASITDFESPPDQTLLLELFSSENKKGSPDAEKWINQYLASPELWKTVFPVVYHVEYNDKPGWPDKFVKKEFTHRFMAFAKKWGVRVPYVPTLMLNGTEWTGWGREESVPNRSPKSVGVLKAKKVTMDEFGVTFESTDETSHAWVANAVLVGCGLSTIIEGGDNLGKTMDHEFTALRVVSQPMELERGAYKATIKLPQKTEVRTNGLAVIFWVTNGDDVIPIQAVGGYIILPVKKDQKGHKADPDTLYF